jgi:hypothetical protein
VNGGSLTINGALNEARRIDLNGLTGETEIYDVSPR